jgi:hypothetical protein
MVYWNARMFFHKSIEVKLRMQVSYVCLLCFLFTHVYLYLLVLSSVFHDFIGVQAQNYASFYCCSNIQLSIAVTIIIGRIMQFSSTKNSECRLVMYDYSVFCLLMLISICLCLVIFFLFLLVFKLRIMLLFTVVQTYNFYFC